MRRQLAVGIIANKLATIAYQPKQLTKTEQQSRFNKLNFSESKSCSCFYRR